MPVERRCDHCGRPYEAKRKTSRFCCDSCRAKHGQGRPAKPVVTPMPRPTEAGVVRAAREALEAAGRLGSPLGAAALALAERVDSGEERGSALAAVVKELRATLAEATKDATAVGDPVDELRARREKRLRGAG